MNGLKLKKIALCIAVNVPIGLAAVLLVALNFRIVGIDPVFAHLAQTAYQAPWWERLLSLLEPLIGAQAIGLLVTFFYAFLGKWGNHQTWDWAKFEKTLIISIINGFIYTGLQILTGWSWADIELWVTEIAGLYVVQKFLKGIGAWLEPVLGRLQGNGG